MISNTIIYRKKHNGIASIDCLKLFFALCVVAIHIRTFMNLKYTCAIDWLIACAVPFFFITSGYLLGKKRLEDNERSAYFRKKAFNVFKILLLWVLIYLPLDLYELSIDGKIYDIKEMMFYIWGVITAGVGITGWPLWYIYTLGVILFIFSYFVHKRWLVLSFAFVCYVVGYLVSRKIAMPHPAFTTLISNSLNGGGCFVTGVILSMIDKNSIANVVVCMTLSLLMSIMLYICKMPYASLLGGVFFFMSCLCASHVLKFESFWKRRLSMWIFYTHMIALYFYYILIRRLDLGIPTMIEIIGAYVVVILLGCIITELSQRMPRLNYLIN